MKVLLWVSLCYMLTATTVVFGKVCRIHLLAVSTDLTYELVLNGTAFWGQTCVTTITANNSLEFVLATISSRYEATGGNNRRPYCKQGGLDIFDGDSMVSDHLGKICGGTGNLEVISSGPSLTFVYNVSLYTLAKKFIIKYASKAVHGQPRLPDEPCASSSAVLDIGGRVICLAGFSALFILVVTSSFIVKRRRRRLSRSREATSLGAVDVTSLVSPPNNRPSSKTYSLPPSYLEVMGSNAGDGIAPPPSYNEVVTGDGVAQSQITRVGIAHAHV